MARAQAQFESFHQAILYGYDRSEELRDRRDTLLEDLNKNISEDAPPFTTFSQGSYALDTGIYPLGGNPDMDIGVLFECSPSDYPDPLVLKRYVSEALERHNRLALIRRPCVTVTYYRAEVPLHHIDLAVYCTNTMGQTQIAWCRDSTPKADREWKPSEAQELTERITGRFSGKDRDQFRRCIRALKRWRDAKIGHKNTPSMGLTVAAYNWFKPCYDNVDGRYVDLYALRDLVNSMLAGWVGTRLHVYLPVVPYSDLFDRMTDIQMEDLKEQLEELRSALDEADAQADTHEACKILRSKFGDDFPVPEKTDTTKSTSAGVSTSGRSA
ncbi:cyclic GMP-AMP synthase DncV-like nucleotidyltransferase [Pseudomonas oryzihabitans]|uniref:cyclic GMP-AMP synthase DncV-like nucleotidyltransferase n=1 Tax=Pseudomonas oryzihabitans TaxID=47885 RepID=UPI0011A2BF9A|nr:nucleotidyltransferase [Pseudomonas oryzihabitans]